jgi:PTS system N-acetylgalactosamine-specific IID component
MASNRTSYVDLTPAASLDQATLNTMVWRSLNLQAAFNYERMQAAGWLWAILPGLQKNSYKQRRLKSFYGTQLRVLQHSPILSNIRYGYLFIIRTTKS